MLTLALADAVNTLLVVSQYHHTFQALDAFVVIDGTVVTNGIDLATAFTQLARGAAEIDPVEHVQPPQLANNGQTGTQWAQVATVELVNKHPGGQQGDGVQHKGPGAIEIERNAGFEWLYFGQLLCQCQ